MTLWFYELSDNKNVNFIHRIKKTIYYFLTNNEQWQRIWASIEAKETADLSIITVAADSREKVKGKKGEGAFSLSQPKILAV